MWFTMGCLSSIASSMGTATYCISFDSLVASRASLTDAAYLGHSRRFGGGVGCAR